MKIIHHLKFCSEKRAGLLADLFDKIGDRLAKAPASTAVRFHHAYEGGLVDHIDEVIKFAIPMSTSLGGFLPMPTPESIVTVAILHDLGKIGDASGNPQYVPNILKNGKQSDAIPFEKDKDKCRQFETGNMEINSILKFADLSDGEASIALLTRVAPDLFLDLSSSEVNAIRYHDGGYGKAKYAAGYQGKEDALAIIIHAADMLSSRKRNIQPEEATP